MTRSTALAMLVALSACAVDGTGMVSSGDEPSADSQEGAVVTGALHASCVWVSSVRGDDSRADGTNRGTPFRSINAAITHAARSRTNRNVCVAAGTYHEVVSLRSGVTVTGGYADNPITSVPATGASKESTIVAEAPRASDGSGFAGVLALGIRSPATFQGFTVRVVHPELRADGASTYGMRIAGGSALVTVRNNRFIVDNGHKGADGESGVAYTHAVAPSGQDGEPACDGCSAAAKGGARPSCDSEEGLTGFPGGVGGVAGLGANADGLKGGAGAGDPGPKSAPADNGAGCGVLSGNGASGLRGAQPYNVVTGGKGASLAYSLSQGQFVGVAGGAGQKGTNGGGGQGGQGGGGSAMGNACVAVSGGGGGSGGCGGLGGRPGQGGQGGGGSFGVFAADGHVHVEYNVFVLGNGGAGGAGGHGGAAQAGGEGGHGGKGSLFGGAGGNGGEGAKGGAGGGGGGGTGGPSAFIAVSSAVALQESDNKGALGKGGAFGLGGGGGWPGHSSANGTQGKVGIAIATLVL